MKHRITDRSSTFFKNQCSSRVNIGKMRLFSFRVTRNPGSFIVSYQLLYAFHSKAEHIQCNYDVTLEDLRKNCHACFWNQMCLSPNSRWLLLTVWDFKYFDDLHICTVRPRTLNLSYKEIIFTANAKRAANCENILKPSAGNIPDTSPKLFWIISDKHGTVAWL